MKVSGNGQAKILTATELKQLFSSGLISNRDRCLFANSFRRTALTQMHNAGIPLRHIQEISGHNDLGTLQRYLEVSPEQKKQAVSVIGW